MASATLGSPLLEEEPQSQEGESTESIAGQVIDACSVNYGRQRTLARLKSTKDGREQRRRESSIVSVLSRLAAPIVQLYSRFVEELTHFSLPAKAGLAGSICSLLCFAPGALSVFNKNGVWAVVTADLALETNVGLTFADGVNMTFGTLVAAALSELVTFLTPMWGAYEPYFVVFIVFLSGALATMFKFRTPFSDRWNPAVAWSLFIFHILILTKADQKDKIKAPMILFITIIVGFLIVCLINLSVAPKYAGTTINQLVAKNFEKAGNVLEGCVIAYCEGLELEDVHEQLEGDAEDNNMHMSFNEIISTDNEVEKLLKAVTFEPCHGKFFYGYPWHMYETISHSLKYTLFDVVELDSCLHSEIQAPLHLRQVFEDEFMCIGKELGEVVRKLGESIITMKHVHSLDAMERAEEGALLLQHKIVKYTTSIISAGNAAAGNETLGEDPDAHESVDAILEEENKTVPSEEPPIERSDSSRSTDSVDSSVRSRTRQRLADRHQDFLQRRETMNRSWDSTVQRIAALSLIKFSALLIELVVKTKFMVTAVDELAHKAHFREDENGKFGDNASKPGIQQV